jgi:hypothetical protein
VRHLDLVNVVLALRFEQPGFPLCLAAYTLRSVGVNMKLPDGTLVSPDLIVCRRDLELALLVEVKGGANLDDNQLGRMLAVTPEHLRDCAYLPEAECQAISVVYVCADEHRPALGARLPLDRVSLLSFDGSAFALEGVPLGDPGLAQCLTGATVPPNTPAPRIVPYDAESPDHEVALAIVPHLVSRLARGSGRITVDALVADTHYLTHHEMASTGSGGDLRGIRMLTKKVLGDLIDGELREWIEPVPKLPDWRIRAPLPVEARARSLAIQSIRRAVSRYLDRKGAGEGAQLLLPLQTSGTDE